MTKAPKHLLSKVQGILRKGTTKLLCMILLISLVATSCKKTPLPDEAENNPDKTERMMGYVVGYDGTHVIQNGIVKSGGYLFISEDLRDTLLANNRTLVDDEYVMGNLLNDLFVFPLQIMPNTECGFTFFAQEDVRFAYKVSMTYRPMTEEELQDVPRLVNAMCYNPYLTHNFKCIVIESIFKVQ